MNEVSSHQSFLQGHSTFIIEPFSELVSVGNAVNEHGVW